MNIGIYLFYTTLLNLRMANEQFMTFASNYSNMAHQNMLFNNKSQQIGLEQKLKNESIHM